MPLPLRIRRGLFVIDAKLPTPPPPLGLRVKTMVDDSFARSMAREAALACIFRDLLGDPRLELTVDLALELELELKLGSEDSCSALTGVLLPSLVVRPPSESARNPAAPPAPASAPPAARAANALRRMQLLIV